MPMKTCPHSFNWRRHLLLLTTAMSTLGILSGCSETTANTTSQPYHHQVKAQTLTLQKHYQTQQRYLGYIKAKQHTNLGFEQAGKITALYAREGDTVTKNSILARQDIALLNIKQQELHAQLQQTRADLTLVNTELKRVRTLQQKGFVSTQQLDELNAQRQVLLATQQRLTASLNGNKVNTGKATLRAPFDAVIGQRLRDEGEVISAGAPVYTLLQTGLVEAEIGVPAQMANNLQQADIQVYVDGRAYKAELFTRGADVDPTSHTLQLRFRLKNAAHLLNGQIAYLDIQRTHTESGYWVPTDAITDGVRGMWNLYALVATEQPSQFRVERRDIELLYAGRDQVYIKGAVQNNERIVATGLHRLAPGQIVKTASAQPESKQ